MGMEDGSVRIQPLRNDDIGLMGPYWSINIHDNNYGKITHLSTSHDDKYLFTVGEDGNFFVFELMEEGKIEERVAAAKAKIPSAKVCVQFVLNFFGYFSGCDYVRSMCDIIMFMSRPPVNVIMFMFQSVADIIIIISLFSLLKHILCILYMYANVCIYYCNNTYVHVRPSLANLCKYMVIK